MPLINHRKKAPEYNFKNTYDLDKLKAMAYDMVPNYKPLKIQTKTFHTQRVDRSEIKIANMNK